MIFRGFLSYLNLNLHLNYFLSQILITTFSMSRALFWFFKWSLEISGGSIVLFNFQPYERRENIIAMWKSARNSFRSVYYLYGTYGEFKEILGMDRNSEEFRSRVSDFKVRSAEKVRQLCEINGGVYARMGQIVSAMTGVLPQDVLSQLKNLKNIESGEIEY